MQLCLRWKWNKIFLINSAVFVLKVTNFRKRIPLTLLTIIHTVTKSTLIFSSAFNELHEGAHICLAPVASNGPCFPMVHQINWRLQKREKQHHLLKNLRIAIHQSGNGNVIMENQNSFTMDALSVLHPYVNSLKIRTLSSAIWSDATLFCCKCFHPPYFTNHHHCNEQGSCSQLWLMNIMIHKHLDGSPTVPYLGKTDFCSSPNNFD